MIELPVLTADQQRTIECWLAAEERMSWTQRQENAGRQLAFLANRLLDDDLVDRPVVVLAGCGEKGGGGLAAAHHLLDEGAWVQILLTQAPEQGTGVFAQQLAHLQTMGVPLAWAEEGWELPPADLVIDAILSHDEPDEPNERARALIQLANSSVAPLLSLGAPSGLDPTTGQLAIPHIRAAATLLLALPQSELLREPSLDVCGALYLADMGVLLQFYTRLGLAVPPLFARDPVARLDVVAGKAVVREE